MKTLQITFAVVFAVFSSACSSRLASSEAGALAIRQTEEIVSLQNVSLRLEFNLSTGRYSVFEQGDPSPALSNAYLKINDWSSSQPDMQRSWKQRQVNGAFGKGLALDLSFRSKDSPELLFSFILYEEHDFLSATAGVVNPAAEAIRIKDIYVLADAEVYGGADLTKNFAMVDGFSGGEPLEYGERFYNPLTRSNALKSRNNILLTFTEQDRRRVLTMGGLSYHHFEKFATIAQPRRTELALGRDQQASLLCYLDLPREDSDASPGGERLQLVQGKELRTWENHEFRCSEMATSAKDPERIIIEVDDLKKDRPYTLGFSWWQGLRHSDHPDLRQSVFVEYEKEGQTRRVPLVENHKLPRFDGQSKEDVEQVELPLPSEAIRAGKLRLVIEKAEPHEGSVYLSEVWIRDGRHQALLPSQLTAVAESTRPRRAYTGQLFASDPVGKRVAPGARYTAPDAFYIDVSGSDPFVALEDYGMRVRKAQGIELNLYDFPTVCLFYAEANQYGGASEAENSTLGAVEETRRIAESGFFNYSRAAVRLVPDAYTPNNQQGWFDDEHWQREYTDRAEEGIKYGRHVEPYETTEKWGMAVTELGGIPLTYFQTCYRSEDYVAEFPGHMLFNQRYAWKGEPVDPEGEIFTDYENTWVRNGRVVWGYDYTDPDFLAHMRRVYANLKKGKIRGLMFDYPASGWPRDGGMEDEDATAAEAYRNIFSTAQEGLGPDAYVHERNMERGTDVSIGLVESMRTENDTDEMDGVTVTRCGLRWYKNRVLVSLDTDSKNLVELEGNRDHVRAVLTMAYVTTGRLLLANSFSQFSPETLRDLTRTFPYHSTPKSARPVDAFVSDAPAVYDYAVNPQWHQVTCYNADMQQPKTVGIEMSGPQVDGALGLRPDRNYHLFDFWNHRWLGKLSGSARLEQNLRPGEARMLAVRECLNRPQVLSTDRHLMQGYLDLSEVEWQADNLVLSGASQVVGNDPYRISIALNGYTAIGVTTEEDETDARLSSPQEGLVELQLKRNDNKKVRWSVCFNPE